MFLHGKSSILILGGVGKAIFSYYWCDICPESRESLRKELEEAKIEHYVTGATDRSLKGSHMGLA